MYRVFAYIDLDTDFFVSWKNYTSVAKQVRIKDGIIIRKSEPKEVQTNGYPIPIYFEFNNKTEADQYNFYFDVYYKKKLIAVDIRSKAWDDVPSNIKTPSYKLKSGHRDDNFNADHSKFREAVQKVIEKPDTAAQGKIQVIQKTESVTSPSDGDVPVTQRVISNDLNAVIQQIGDIISHGEGGYEGWNAGTLTSNGKVHHGSMNDKAGTVTGKTINQILATKSLSGEDPNKLFATGKYQTIITTLDEAKTKLKLTGNELYTPELQERVFREFLFEKAGRGKLSDYVKRGKGSVDDAMEAASHEWASIAVPNGRLTKHKKISDGTITYYDDGANHANQISTKKLRDILESIKLGANSSNTAQTNPPVTSSKIEPISGVQVLFSGVDLDKQTIVSEKSKNILAAMAKEAGMSKIQITSTIRTPEKQAALMMNPTATYGKRGQAVLAVRDEYASQGREVQLSKMVEKIKEFWAKGENVSNHVVSPENYKLLNVVDIGLNTNGFGTNNQASALGQNFQTVFERYMSSGVLSSKSISPYHDKKERAFHIEIPQ